MSGLPAGYDAWRTDSGYSERDYEEQQPLSELEEADERIRELEDDARIIARVHAARVKELEAALHECLEYFQDRTDIANEHDEDGSPRPNKEMRFASMIDEALHGIRF